MRSSVAVLLVLCMCVGVLICGVCFLRNDYFFSSLRHLLLVSPEGCASYFLAFPGYLCKYFCSRIFDRELAKLTMLS